MGGYAVCEFYYKMTKSLVQLRRKVISSEISDASSMIKLQDDSHCNIRYINYT